MPQEFQPTQMLTVTLEAQEWNIVLAGLAELPLKYSGALNTKVRQQLLENSADVDVITGNGKDYSAAQRSAG